LVAGIGMALFASRLAFSRRNGKTEN